MLPPFSKGLSSPRQRRLSFGTCVAGMIIAGIIGYKIAYLNKDVDHRIVEAEHNHHIQLEAKKKLAEHLKLLQQQNSELTQKLTLYQRLTGSNTIKQTVKVKAFQVFPTVSNGTFRYVVMLTKEALGQEVVQGRLSMTIIGKIGEQLIHLPVKYIHSERRDGLGFKFKHFQELTGELSFPDHFVAEEVSFKVSLDKNAGIFEQTVPWHVLA